MPITTPKKKTVRRHTSTLRYNVILAGVQLTLKEAGEKLNGIRRQSKGRNFSPSERDIRMQLRLMKEAVALAEEELDKHMTVYDEAKFFSVTNPVALPNGSCPECEEPSCNGCCDSGTPEVKVSKEE